ncbi:MAG TPA: AraC family transcriptional regulator [Steroidobacteraceae bacterium]|nr:AraC family transcriptional regulator [Steroidobacteraceae bacterium]
MNTLACGCPTSSQVSRHAGEFGFRCSVNLPSCGMGAHHHPEPRIVFPLQFGFDTRFGTRAMRVDEAAAVFRPAGEEHEDRYRLPTTCLSLLLPGNGPAAYLREPFMMRDVSFRSLAEALRREIVIADAASPLVMEGLALLASSRILHQAPLWDNGMPRWIDVVRERVQAEYLSPPSLADLGRMVQRDAAYVAATFKRIYGKSVGTYIRHLRLWQARRCLQTEPGCSLAEIAQRCGFADQSHFNRQFRRLFALTPLEYLERHGAGPAAHRSGRRRGVRGHPRAGR